MAVIGHLRRKQREDFRVANGNQEYPGSVASGIAHPAEPRGQTAEVFIGRWINEGYVVQENGTPESKILVSDVYEWAPGRFFVIHPAYGSDRRCRGGRGGDYRLRHCEPEVPVPLLRQPGQLER